MARWDAGARGERDWLLRVNVADPLNEDEPEGSLECRSVYAVTQFMANRKRERERRAVPDLALHPDPPPVEFDELPRECEPEPRALHLLVRGPHLPELLEDRLLIFGGNADSGIRDGNLCRTVLQVGGDIDPPSLGGEFQGVGQEI